MQNFLRACDEECRHLKQQEETKRLELEQRVVAKKSWAAVLLQSWWKGWRCVVGGVEVCGGRGGGVRCVGRGGVWWEGWCVVGGVEVCGGRGGGVWWEVCGGGVEG